MPAPAPRAAKRLPTVVEGTAPARTAEATQAFLDAVAATKVDERVWTGAFATNVWAGRYAVDGVLGEGGQGCTFTGADLKTGARVAVKVLDLKAASDWKAVELFDREVAALKSVEHKGLPSFLDVISDDETGARALVMTLVPGEDLDKVMKAEGPMGEAALWRALVDVADVLAALHAKPLLHRDVKPKNLVRKPDGTIAVVDLGGVGHVRGAAGSTVVGTFGYMAPEQLYGRQTPATDLYALGATMLTLATGKEPEDQPRAGLALDVDAAAPHLSPPLRTVLKRLLAPDPTQRPADARAFIAELHDVARTRTGDADARRRSARDDDSDSGEHVIEPEVVDPRRVGDAMGGHDVDDAAKAVLGALQVVVGVLGSVGVVLFGQILLPLLFTILAAFQTQPQQRARLLAMRRSVEDAARHARAGFGETAQRGATSFEELEHLQRERERRKKEARRARKDARRARRGR